ncbi:hexokinase type 2 isoform X2 [Belonocnema kinseyi]|uniref:hexokinase type 2 isoform X2 n=1 Tax=Belonocnema kinseyi TaxID=2817044 RepID=UPI00143D7AB9|nr:hexokinase type 2 isoform X2 [Belonocnema kinseyi]XP_033208747.1 hexokinase type 2 isoform X2 [Belonocnema kinseyi]XP_033208749.1 hexokinase type 2 isoform X2 [Belonocnema kinseyi]
MEAEVWDYLAEKWEHIEEPIRETCKELILSEDQMRKIMERLTDDINKGLSKSRHDEAVVKCYTTYVQDLPNGTEKGNFLALDLGGTNFRVLLITLDGQNFDMKSKIYAIPQSLMLGTGTQLFDHIAQCLALFVKDLNLQTEVLPLGFTFSFPLVQEGLTEGRLVRWTKGFNCSGVVDEDVVSLLEAAIARRNDVKIDVCAILNDTTGTLMSCAWKNKNCRIGLILGTGSNACYVEKTENAERAIPGKYVAEKPHMLINMEWGAFGERDTLDFVITEFDKDIDDNSIHPGKQIFEKMISGMYMGELVRLVLEKLVNSGLLFGGKCPSELRKRGKFFTKYVSEIENDPKGKYTNCREVLAEIGIRNVTDQDCENVRYVCSVVSRRAAHLASAGIAAVLNKMGEDNVTVGVDGSVYRFHPHFHDLMTEKIGQLQNHKFDLMLSEDGSGRGAALVAAVASQKR